MLGGGADLLEEQPPVLLPVPLGPQRLTLLVHPALLVVQGALLRVAQHGVGFAQDLRGEPVSQSVSQSVGQSVRQSGSSSPPRAHLEAPRRLLLVLGRDAVGVDAQRGAVVAPPDLLRRGPAADAQGPVQVGGAEGGLALLQQPHRAAAAAHAPGGRAGRRR